MKISPLTPEVQPHVLAYLRASPYRNALPLSNVGQLRAHCDVLVATADKHVVGMVSSYRALPLPNLTFVADNTAVVGELLAGLLELRPGLQGMPIYALLPEDRWAQLAKHAYILDSQIEYQMVVEPETLRVPGRYQARRLSQDDLPAMDALAAAADLETWHAGALALGPAFGCFAGDQLVAMGGTHFATPEVIELGYIATHPNVRGQGYASAVTAALAQAAFRLAPRVFLMVLEHNTPALRAYKQLGFRTIEHFWLAQFLL